MSQFRYRASVYFNGVSLIDFRRIEDTSHELLKSKLNNLLRYRNNKGMVKIKYCSPLIDNEWEIRFSKFELKTSEDLRVM